MWMTSYIEKVRQQLRDVHGFVPSSRSAGTGPIFDSIPDGEFPVTINGRLDRVCIKDGQINCCNFD